MDVRHSNASRSGAILEDFAWNAQLELNSEDCAWWDDDDESENALLAAQFPSSTGTLVFSDLRLGTRDESIDCPTIIRTVVPRSSFTVKNLACRVPVRGCKEGYRVKEDRDEYLTCREGACAPLHLC